MKDKTSRLRVIVLPNKPWKLLIQSYRQGEAPDPNRLRELLAERGIDLIGVDPLAPPANPWGRANPFLAGFDPLRALMVLLSYRSVDLVISVFESGAVVLLLLRRVFLFKAAVAMWDVSVGGNWRPRLLALRLALPRIDRLFVLTRWQKTATEQQYRLRSPAEVIGYAIDEEFYRPYPTHAAQYILSVGEDNARDYPTLISAMRCLPAPLVLKTQRVVDLPTDHAATMTIMRDRLSPVGLRDLYAAAAIVVIPLRLSDTPSGITSLFEAMAMAKAIIVSDVPMIHEFVTAGETGLIVPVGDAAALQAAIAFLLARPDEQRRLGCNARVHLDANLTMASFADRLASVIHSTAAKRNKVSLFT